MSGKIRPFIEKISNFKRPCFVSKVFATDLLNPLGVEIQNLDFKNKHFPANFFIAFSSARKHPIKASVCFWFFFLSVFVRMWQMPTKPEINGISF